LFQRDSDDIFISDTPSNGDTNPVSSQTIEEFDSNDVVFDEAALKEV
jgi:hypothetical protein